MGLRMIIVVCTGTHQDCLGIIFGILTVGLEFRMSCGAGFVVSDILPGPRSAFCWIS